MLQMDEVELKTSEKRVKLKIGDKFATVIKKQVEIPFYLPIINEVVIYEFNIGEIGHYSDGMEKYYAWEGLLDDDGIISKELSIFKPEYYLSDNGDKSERVYFFVRVWNENKTEELPLFYGSLYMEDYIDSVSYNRKNFIRWRDYIHKELIAHYIYLGSVDPSYFYEWFSIQHDLASYIFEMVDEYLNPEKFKEMYDEYDRDESIACRLSFLTQRDEEFDKEYGPTDTIADKIGKISDRALKSYMSNVLISVCDFFLEKNIVSRCGNCGDFFKYKKSKKYCSESCLKSQANRRQYQKRVK